MKKRKPDHVDGRALAESLYGCEKPKKKLSKPDHKRKEAIKRLFGRPSLPHPKNEGGSDD